MCLVLSLLHLVYELLSRPFTTMKLVLATFLSFLSVVLGDSEEISNSMEARSRCHTLCEAGLGGHPCGCSPDTVNMRFQQEITTWRLAHPNEHIIIGPRRDLCLSLCPQGLGEPLCDCSTSTNAAVTNSSMESLNWCTVCRDVLLLEKSPNLWKELQCDQEPFKIACNNTEESHKKYKRDAQINTKDTQNSNQTSTYDVLRSDEDVDWNLWCEIQCGEHNGGLACNCDMYPLRNDLN